MVIPAVTCCTCSFCIELEDTYICKFNKENVYMYWTNGICNQKDNISDICPLKGPDIRFDLDRKRYNEE